jgi:GH24 family phage-related lysozyme (muramidase)
MKFEIVDDCPVPAGLADCVREIKRQTGARLASCDRSKEAEPYLRRLGKQSQRQLYDGWVRRLPGYNPANPPGFSTHERRNDGTAYPGPRGMVLRYWQVGMDWSDSEAVVRAAAKLGFTATRTYPRDQREHHHLNFRKEPKVKLRRLLKLGSKGYRVAKMTRDLTIARDPTGKPYLDKGQGIFDEKVDAALRRFQKDWDQLVDGVYGEQTARQLAVAVRAAKRAAKEKKEVPVKPEPPTPEPAVPTALSPAGATFIAKFEGFRSALYNDPAGHCTIGFGHLVHHGPINGSEPKEFKAGITRERALELLQADAASAASAIRKNVKVPLTQQQFDALVSFAYNVGSGAFGDSTLLKKLNAGEYDAVPAQLNRWVKAEGKTLEGLVRRRAAEGALFSRGMY